MAMFKQGDRIAHSRGFVKYQGGCLKDVADRRGTIVKLAFPVRGSADKGFYTVAWDDTPGEEATVLSANLAPARKIHLEQV